MQTVSLMTQEQPPTPQDEKQNRTLHSSTEKPVTLSTSE
jgi:hypothetical protein